MFGSDGRLYAAERSRHRVVAYRPDGKVDVLATGGEPIDLAVTSKGAVYFTDGDKSRVWLIPLHGAPRIVTEESARNPVGVRVNPDESQLVIADHVGRPVWSFRIEPDGNLSNGQPFHHLELPDEANGGPPLRPAPMA